MSSHASVLRLLPPGTPLEPDLLARCERALGASARVWYLVPDARTRRQRLTALARRVPLLDPCVGTLRDLALRALAEAGEPAAAPADPGLVEALLQKALARVLSELPGGPGRVAAARRSLQRLLHRGWPPHSLARELARLEERHPATEPLDALWRAMERLCPEIDVARPLRRVLEAGLLQRVAPELLLVEGGPLRGELEARLLRDLVRRVRDRGGDVVATCLDLPALPGPRGRTTRLLRELLPVEPAAAGDAGPERGALRPVRL